MSLQKINKQLDRKSFYFYFYSTLQVSTDNVRYVSITLWYYSTYRFIHIRFLDEYIEYLEYIEYNIAYDYILWLWSNGLIGHEFDTVWQSSIRFNIFDTVWYDMTQAVRPWPYCYTPVETVETLFDSRSHSRLFFSSMSSDQNAPNVDWEFGGNRDLG